MIAGLASHLQGPHPQKACPRTLCANPQPAPTPGLNVAGNEHGNPFSIQVTRTIEDVVQDHNGDPQRVYLAGQSMGGHGFPLPRPSLVLSWAVGCGRKGWRGRTARPLRSASPRRCRLPWGGPQSAWVWTHVDRAPAGGLAGHWALPPVRFASGMAWNASPNGEGVGAEPVHTVPLPVVWCRYRTRAGGVSCRAFSTTPFGDVTAFLPHRHPQASPSITGLSRSTVGDPRPWATRKGG